MPFLQHFQPHEQQQHHQHQQLHQHQSSGQLAAHSPATQTMPFLQHLQPQQQPQHQHHQSGSQHSSHSSGSQTMPFLQHLQQQQQQQQQQQHLHHLQQQHTMQHSHYPQNSSDYSSSTYHIYDQILGDQIIDDLIVIKQERMKKKLEQEHKRKVILFSCAIILLVGLLLFLLVQLFRASSSSSAGARASPELQQYAQMRPNWAPSLGAHSTQRAPLGAADYFDASKLTPQQQPADRRAPLQLACSGHGALVQLVDGQPPVCHCKTGYFGDQCQDLVRCGQFGPSFCNNNGHCDRLTGRCNCFPGFLGAQCEFRQSAVALRLPSAPASEASTQQARQPPAERPSACALLLNNCNGNGICDQLTSRCNCQAAFAGAACEIRLGAERQQVDLCAGQLCSGHGQCEPETGACRCRPGYVGQRCELFEANCSQRGHYDFVQGKCVCDFGFSGRDCSEMLAVPADGAQQRAEEGERQLAPSDQAAAGAAPTAPATSVDCDGAGASNQSLPLDCGPFGAYRCAEQRCVCQDGYTGELCRVARCPARCLRNGGQCAPDGQCACPPGRYGRHCTFDGCPNGCSGRGECARLAGTPNAASEWRCQCQPGATGDDCAQLSERQCDDGLDNDGDGLVDCADSECCVDKVCQNSTLCLKSPDPLDILMRKQPPPPTSSFFQRMQFLIEKFSSQIYSHPKDFNDSLLASKYADRASVIRGRVTYLSQGVTGVRVSVAGQINLGITVTRDNGHFDLMVNGGGTVVLEFQREPFAAQQRPVRVPWNEIVLVDNVELELETASGNRSTQETSSKQQEQQSVICSAHNYRLMKPQIIATGSKRRARNNQKASASSSVSNSSSNNNSRQQNANTSANKLQRAVILRNSALVQQKIVLPNSSSGSAGQEQQVSLVYISSKANEFMSTLSVQLTPQASKLPDELKLVHLRIVIEGNLFEQQFEPQQNLSFTYAWNRRNVYKQKSFGLSTALVSVGYEYFDCERVIWFTKQLQLAGHDLSISDIGNQWNLNIHHRLNHRDSILQRGDGQNFNLRAERPLVVQPQMGDGYQRASMCPYCDGQSAQPSEHRLLRPQALVLASDNALYVGDHNLIRRLEPGSWSTASAARGERIVRTILELPTVRPQPQQQPPQLQPLRYALALSSGPEARLYLADQERAQVFFVRERQDTNESLPVPALSGADNGAALLDGSLALVAGSGVRCQLGEQRGARDNCGDSGPARAARLIEPRALAFDLTNRMYLADGPNVRVVEPADGKIYTLLGDYSAAPRTGASFPCAPGETVPMHKFAPRAPQSLALSPIDDTLHLLDENVVYKITQDKRVQLVAGRPAHCLTGQAQQQQHKLGNSAAGQRASEFAFQAAQSIAFNPSGQLLVAEDEPRLGQARVLLVEPEEDLVTVYAGAAGPAGAADEHQQQQQQDNKQRASNTLPGNQAPRASEYRFASIGAIAVDQRGNLLVADRQLPRIVSIEPDLPQMNAAGEYELQSPDEPDELLVFNRFGHHIATRELSGGAGQASSGAAPSNQRNKYTFSYNVNTSFGQLASVLFANGNKLSIYRDGPHHSVKMIETAFGGQCKLDISRQGQVHSIALSSSQAGGASTKIGLTYQIDGGLLRQSRDQSSGEVHEFAYDEFGRAQAVSLTSPRLPAPVECRLQLAAAYASPKLMLNSYIGQECGALIVAD